MLLRRRRGDLQYLAEHVEDAVQRPRARAERAGLEVHGAPVSLSSCLDDQALDEHERVIEVCPPMSGEDGDALLPGGQLAFTEAAGPGAAYPQVLVAYGAVLQWAHQTSGCASAWPPGAKANREWPDA